MTVRIFLADDHNVVRLGLRALLAEEAEFRVVGEAADGTQVVAAVERLRPDVLLLDLLLPGLTGLEVARQVRQRIPRTRVVMLSSVDDEEHVVEALRHGARGYVLKGADASDVVRAVHEIAAGGTYLSSPLAARATEIWSRVTHPAAPEPLEALTTREREVLYLLLEGWTSPAIAERLHIGTRTVETHRSNLMRSLGVKTQAELVRLAMRKGLVPSEME